MGKKIPQEEIFQRFNEIHNGKYTYHNDYKNTRTKIKITCPIHGDFNQTPKRHLLGQGCPMCAQEKLKDNSQNYLNFLVSAAERHKDNFSYPYIKDEYINSHSKITIKCNECGFEYKKIANDFICAKNHKCPNCEKNQRQNDKLINFEMLKNILLDVEIIPFDGYRNITTDKVTLRCPKHGDYESRIESVLKKKYHCRLCELEDAVKKIKLTPNEVKRRIDDISKGTIFPLMKTYKNTMEKMLFVCKNCGTIFARKPNTFFTLKRKLFPCPHCAKKEISKQRIKSTNDFILEAKQKHGDKYDYKCTNYTASNQKIEVICKECGKTFYIEANSHLQGHGCPYHNCNKSKKEQEIANFITNLGFDILQNNRTILDGKELDIFIPSKNIAIEFDGLFWHNELNKEKNSHITKTIECNKKGIRLLHIFEDEWIYKSNIWKSMLKAILGVTENKIYARKCEIKNVPLEEAKVFLENNHIQGYCNSHIRYGLYYNNELVSLMTFGPTRHFIGSKKHQYELLRFCNKLNHSVVGGASKLLKYFIKNHNPLSIVSYADRRWSVGNLYEKLNFNLYNASRPNYFYVIGDKRYNRFNFRKSQLIKEGFDPNLSEREIMFQRKIYRIYDCGCLCYELLF